MSRQRCAIEQQFTALAQSEGNPIIAVLIPCLNEEQAIAGVVRDFQDALSGAAIHVYDNGSEDGTIAQAIAAGAVVMREGLRGKGHVVRRMFADIEADFYILVDGDGTYHAPTSPLMVEKLMTERLDMVVASRISTDDASYRTGHQFGNRMLTSIVGMAFGNRFQDMLSGYRVFSRRFVKSFPALSRGFEIETELTIHALSLGMPAAEISSPYGARAANNPSKLRTYRDGFRILLTILRLLREERPLLFFSVLSIIFMTAAAMLAVPLVITYVETGFVPRFPTAILCTGMTILSFLSLVCGVVVDSLARMRREMRRLFYLATSPRGPVARSDG